MKKIFALAAFACCSLASMAQFNLQFHGDLGRPTNPNSEADRQIFTTTAEFFKADKLGSTYMFIDLDYTNKRNEIGNGNRGMLGAYWEISREFTFAKVKESNSSFAAHMEYDAGLKLSTSFQQCFLVGPAWNWHSNDFSKTFSLQAMYKQFLTDQWGHDAHASAQATAVWGTTFAKGWITCSGFADVWYGYTPQGKKGCIFLAEPQLWFNVLNKANTQQKLAFGTEWELSNNFIYATGGTSRTFFWNPTIAAKWTF